MYAVHSTALLSSSRAPADCAYIQVMHIAMFGIAVEDRKCREVTATGLNAFNRIARAATVTPPDTHQGMPMYDM